MVHQKQIVFETSGHRHMVDFTDQVATIVVLSPMIRCREVEARWTETLLIALAHYFSSRRFIKLPPVHSPDITGTGAL